MNTGDLSRVTRFAEGILGYPAPGVVFRMWRSPFPSGTPQAPPLLPQNEEHSKLSRGSTANSTRGSQENPFQVKEHSDFPTRTATHSFSWTTEAKGQKHSCQVRKRRGRVSVLVQVAVWAHEPEMGASLTWGPGAARGKDVGTTNSGAVWGIVSAFWTEARTKASFSRFGSYNDAGPLGVRLLQLSSR